MFYHNLIIVLLWYISRDRHVGRPTKKSSSSDKKRSNDEKKTKSAKKPPESRKSGWGAIGGGKQEKDIKDQPFNKTKKSKSGWGDNTQSLDQENKKTINADNSSNSRNVGRPALGNLERPPVRNTFNLNSGSRSSSASYVPGNRMQREPPRSTLNTPQRSINNRPNNQSLLSSFISD